MKKLTLFLFMLAAAHPNCAFRLLAAVAIEPSPLDLTLPEKVGQLLQIQVYGDSANDRSGDFQRSIGEIRRDHIGSVDFRVRLDRTELLRQNPEKIAKSLNALQAASKIPLLVGADIERGVIARVADAPDVPHIMAWCASGDFTAIRKVGEITAREARAVGIHWAFAPVVDVNSDPNNPVIGDRSCSDDPAQVGRMAAQFIEGAHSQGLFTTAKHFPGHGNTNSDSHYGIVTLSQNLSQLRAVDFPPFQKAIAAGVDAVMLAHARVPALDPDPRAITTTSKRIIGGTLRGELGFRGLVITDSMEMRGLTELYKGEANPTGRAAIDALKAGADIIMLPEHADQAYDAIINAVVMGEIAESRIDESVGRILAMKKRAGLFRNRFVDVSKVHEVFSRKADWDLAQQVADNAVTLVRNKTFVLPLRRTTTIDAPETEQKGHVLILLTDSHLSHLGKAFEEEYRERQSDVQIRHIYYDSRSTWETGDLLDIIRGSNSVVVAAFMTNLQGRKGVTVDGKVVNVVGLNGHSAELFEQIVSTAGPKVIVVSLGSPYLILKYPALQNYMCTFSVSSTSERSAVKALFGEVQNKAGLPVSLPGVAERGFALKWPRKAIPPRGSR